MARCASPRPKASAGARRRRGAGPGRRQLGAARLGRRLGCRLLAARGVEVAPLVPANCGFDVDWSAHFSSRHAGAPLTTVAIVSRDATAMRAGAGRASSWSRKAASRAAWCTRCRRRCATRFARAADHHLARPAAGSDGAARAWRSGAAARRTFDVEPPAEPAGIKGVKAGLLRECLSQGTVCRPGRAGPGDQGAAARAASAPDRRGDQQRGRRALRGMGQATMLRRCRACSWPARWSTGKRRPAAIC
jgi:hypothetical protein